MCTCKFHTWPNYCWISKRYAILWRWFEDRNLEKVLFRLMLSKCNLQFFFQRNQSSEISELDQCLECCCYNEIWIRLDRISNLNLFRWAVEGQLMALTTDFTQPQVKTWLMHIFYFHTNLKKIQTQIPKIDLIDYIVLIQVIVKRI